MVMKIICVCWIAAAMCALPLNAKCINKKHIKELEYNDKTGATVKTTVYRCAYLANDDTHFDENGECYRCGCPKSAHDNQESRK